MSLLTESPAWLIIVCLSGSALITWILYRKDKTFEKPLSYILLFLRFVFLSLLSFLLLTPLIRTIHRFTQKPIIVFAQDDSESILVNGDSTFYRSDYANQVHSLLNELSKKYEVNYISFGDKPTEEPIDEEHPSYEEKQSDYNALFDDLSIRYANRNVGAYILAGDGLFNRGSNPLYAQLNPTAPLYTLALGDTTVRKDLFIANVRYNQVAYLNNTFPIELLINARQCQAENAVVSVMEDSLSVFNKTIPITSNRFSQLLPVYLDAKKKGVHHYRISLAPLTDEITTVNNFKDIYIEVRESKEKILILAAAPHPDIAALRQSIESNQNYEVSVQIIGQADVLNNPALITQSSLAILHQIPSESNIATEVITRLRQSSVPVWFILGAQTNVNAFNSLKEGINIRNPLNKNNDVLPVYNPTFSSFNLSNETVTALASFPPLVAPFGDYKSITASNELLRQKIGSIVTDQPLLTFFDEGNVKNAVLAGEGLWRWKLNDYQLHNNNNAFNEIIIKTVQLLSTRETKAHLKVITKNSFFENDPVIFDAEVYNDNYELINTPDVALNITNRQGKSFPYVFSKTERTYSLNAGLFAPGEYHYRATVKLGEKVYAAEGDFSVAALQVELSETIADHQLLYALAHKNGGQMYYASQLKELADKLMNSEDIKTVSYSEIRLDDFINLKWFFFLLLALISFEWFLRKRNGSY